MNPAAVSSRRSWSWSSVLLAVLPFALIASLAIGGMAVIGVPFSGFGFQLPASAVRLDHDLPPITRDPVLHVTGVTRPRSLVSAYVDEAPIGPAVSEIGDGSYALDLPLGGLGAHTIRIEVRYGHPQIDELLLATVRRVPPDVPSPQVLAVERWPALNGYYLLVRSNPGTTVGATGVTTLEPLSDDAHVDRTGRAAYFIAPVAGALPTLTATDEAGVASQPTAPIDLQQLATTPPVVPAVERVDVAVSYTVDRRSVDRTETVRLDPTRVELADLTQGLVGASTFLQEVAGPAGIAPLGQNGCLVSSVRDAMPDVQIADTATVTLTDAFPGLLTQWNGYTDTPGLSLCFPRGMPARRDTGSVEMRLRGYVFTSVSMTPTSASIDKLDTGGVERVYRWDRVPFDGRIDVTFAAESPSPASLLPSLGATTRPGPQDGPGVFAGALGGAFVGSVGSVFLLWLVTSAPAASWSRRRRVLRNVLVVALALGLMPAFRSATLLAIAIGNYSEVVNLATEHNVDPTSLGELAVTLIVLIGALAGIAVVWLAARLLHRRGELWISIGLALVLASILWLGAGVLEWIIAAWGRDKVPLGVVDLRLTVWVVGTVEFGAVLTFILASLARLRSADATRPTSMRLLVLAAWAVLLAALFALPAGVEGSFGTTQAEAWSYVRSTTASLALLAAFAVPVIVLVALVALIRAAWTESAWFTLHGSDPTGWGASRWISSAATRHLVPAVASVIFAAFAIGAGGILQPVAIVVALLLFGLLLRPDRELDGAAALATGLLSRREAALRDALGRSTGEPTVSDGAVAGPEAEWRAQLRRASVWANVRFALRAGLVLQVPLFLLYLAQYPLASVTREDPLYAQRLVFSLTSFVVGWLFVALAFGLAYDYLRSSSGLRKGLTLGGAILAVTIPIQLLYGITSSFSPLEVTVWVLEVGTFTVLLGALFDLRIPYREGRVHWDQPRGALRELGVVSGLPDLVAGAGVLATTVVATALALLSGQVTQIVTRALSPFLPLPPN